MVYGLAFSPDGKKLISGGLDSIAILWDVETQHRCSTGWKAIEAMIHAVGFTPDGQRAVTGSL